MARIRSIHPNQWTDDAFVSCSPLARLFALALRCEADDNGIFPWRPLQLKMRLLPNDDADVDALLAELIDTDQVYKFEHNGKQMGIIRNFQRFQSPRKPTFQHPIPHGPLPDGYELHPDDSRTSAEPVRYQCGTGDVPPPPERRGEEGKGGEKREMSFPSREKSAAADPSLSISPEFRDVVQEWNTTATAAGLPTVQKLTDARCKALRARMRDPYFREHWRPALARLPDLPFARGNNARGWRANIDWFLRPDTVAKILEGAYDSQGSGNGTHTDTQEYGIEAEYNPADPFQN